MPEVKMTCSVCRGRGQSPFNSMASCTHCGGFGFVYTMHDPDPWEAAVIEWGDGLFPIWLRILIALVGVGGSYQMVIASGLDLPVWGLVCVLMLGGSLAYQLPRMIAMSLILVRRLVIGVLLCVAGVAGLYALLWVLDAPIVR